MFSRYVAHVFSEWLWNSPSRPYYYRYRLCFYIPHALYFYSKVFIFYHFSASFLITFLSPEIATSINIHVFYYYCCCYMSIKILHLIKHSILLVSLYFISSKYRRPVTWNKSSLLTSPLYPSSSLPISPRLFRSTSLTVYYTKGQNRISCVCRISVSSHHFLGSSAVPRAPLDIGDVSFIVNYVYETFREKFSPCTSFPCKSNFAAFNPYVERGHAWLNNSRAAGRNIP